MSVAFGALNWLLNDNHLKGGCHALQHREHRGRHPGENPVTLERDTGKKIIAFKGFDVTPASLDAEALNSICALEQKLGLSLLAVDG